MRYAPTIESTDRPPGVVITDDIQGSETRVQTPGSVDPVPLAPDGFVFPVDTAASLPTSAVRIPKLVNVTVRDGSGAVVATVTNRATDRLPEGSYIVEVESLSVKVYLAIDGAIETSADDTGRIIRTTGDTVDLAARSRHESPGATVTTTDGPRDVMRAVSAFGSALKTTSPERSWPTLRGHPPLLERGESLSIPADLQAARAAPAITVELPPDLAYVYPAASLAFYLNADLRPGDTPRLIAGGREYDLVEPDFQTAIERTLKRVFLLDCVVRTEGLYPIDLAERRALEQRLDIDIPALYDASLPERTARYLEVPHDALEGALPRWKTTADVAPTADSVAHLPFIVADLGLVRCPTVDRSDTLSPPVECIDAFTRGAPSDVSRLRSDGGSVGTATERATNDGGDGGESGRPATALRETESIEHLWIGEGHPMGATKPTVAARKRRLNARPSGDIEVAVVVNDPEMRAESAVRDRYGLRELVQFDVSSHEGLDRASLASLLAEDRDLVHFVGHVDERGLQCADGYLDATEVETVGAQAFVLNACRSYEQGMALVDAGAIAGVVTLANVANVPATKVGRMLARLLNAGFSLGGALDVLSSETVTGQQYSVVGAPGLTLTESRASTPIVADVARASGDRFRLSLHGYATTPMDLGTTYTPNISNDERQYLNSGRIGEFTVTGAQLESFLDLGWFPVRVDGELRWSDELGAADVD